MKPSARAEFDESIEQSSEWLRWLGDALHKDDREFSYTAFRAVMHTLRDTLIPEKAAALGTVLPMLLRGVYYEGWKPRVLRRGKDERDEFLEEVGEASPPRDEYDAERIVHAVFMLLSARLSEDEVEDALRILPEDIKVFWPKATAAL